MEKYQLHKAALASDYETAFALIDLQVDLNETDANGHTALHWAVFIGDVGFVRMLMEAGADPNIFSSDGVTPRWRARDFDLIEIDQLLGRFNGKVLTNDDFDRKSFSVFNKMIGRPLPKEDRLIGKAESMLKKQRWWQLW